MRFLPILARRTHPEPQPALICEYCGAAHDVRELCHARPTFSRRGFLALAGAGIVGAALPNVAPVIEWRGVAGQFVFTLYGGARGGGKSIGMGKIIAEEWERQLGKDPARNIFESSRFLLDVTTEPFEAE